MTEKHTFTPDDTDEQDDGLQFESKDIELTIEKPDEDEDDAEHGNPYLVDDWDVSGAAVESDGEDDDCNYIKAEDLEITRLEHTVNTHHRPIYGGAHAVGQTRGPQEYQISMTITADEEGTDFLQALLDAMNGQYYD